MAFRTRVFCLNSYFGQGLTGFSPRFQLLRYALISLVMMCTLAGPVVEADSGCTEQVPSLPPGGGLKVYVDPDTGELLDEPPPGQQAQAPAVRLREPPIVEQVRPDGTVVADIGNRFVTELRVEVIDGKVVTCHRPVAEPSPTADPAEKLLDQNSGDER